MLFAGRRLGRLTIAATASGPTTQLRRLGRRSILPQLSPAALRILKVAHHGSRTSTSQELLDAWHPQIAIVSCGRGNTFGHPAPEVIDRLKSSGATIYRTDLDGEVTIETDGYSMHTRTYIGGSK